MARRRGSAILALLLIAAPGPARAQADAPSEPPVGSVERKAILDALRRVGDIPDRVFVVRSLRVRDGWAWVAVDPRSRDGSSRYEAESALLRGAAGNWRVVDQPCAEDGCDPRREVARIAAAHPEAPAALFPP